MNLKLCTLLAAAVLAGTVTSRASEIDRLVEARLAQAGLTAAPTCSDATFLRRAYLVTTSRIPSLAQTRAFLESTAADKRTRLVDSLVGSEVWVENEVMRWGDLLRIKSEFPSCIWPNGVQAYNRWLKVCFRDNMPYDRMVRELLTTTGSDFRDAGVNFFRAHVTRNPQAYCEDIALIFMGERTAPAAWQPFFSQIYYKTSKEWKEEFLCLNLDTEAPSRPIRLSEKTAIKLQRGEDFRIPFAQWLTSEDNPQLARALVNRIWYRLFGIGIVDAPDDFRADNPPSNPALLDYLAEDFRAHGYDLQRLYREILKSAAFARSSHTTAALQKHATEAQRLGAVYPLRRLSAETIIDATSDITGSFDRYSSRAPEPFTKYPIGTRSTQIGDGTVTTSQLDLFGRPSRDVSLESARPTTYNSKQTLYLLNSQSLLDKIKHNRTLTSAMYDTSLTRSQLIDQIYLLVLSRHATEAETAAIDRATKGEHVTTLCEDVTWALLNSDEFLFIH